MDSLMCPWNKMPFGLVLGKISPHHPPPLFLGVVCPSPFLFFLFFFLFLINPNKIAATTKQEPVEERG